MLKLTLQNKTKKENILSVHLHLLDQQKMVEERRKYRGDDSS